MGWDSTKTPQMTYGGLRWEDAPKEEALKPPQTCSNDIPGGSRASLNIVRDHSRSLESPLECRSSLCKKDRKPPQMSFQVVRGGPRASLIHLAHTLDHETARKKNIHFNQYQTPFVAYVICTQLVRRALKQKTPLCCDIFLACAAPFCCWCPFVCNCLEGIKIGSSRASSINLRKARESPSMSVGSHEEAV